MDTRRVTIMVRNPYNHLATVIISDFCPKCGKRRGPIHDGTAYDGSERKYVDVWENPCGHVDYYGDVYREAQSNGLNEDNPWM